jgi:hypothetical protein
MNKITIALCEEDRKLLEGLMGSVTLLASVLANAQPKEVQEKVIAETLAPQLVPQPATPDAGHPVDEVSPHAAPEPVAEPAATHHTLDDVRAVVQRLIGPGSTKREAAKAIVEEYAPKLSGIPVDKYDEIMGRLIALEKEAS